LRVSERGEDKNAQYFRGERDGTTTLEWSQRHKLAMCLPIAKYLILLRLRGLVSGDKRPLTDAHRPEVTTPDSARFFVPAY
jgi:hypothetical protein